jgi:hypothetical protein
VRERRIPEAVQEKMKRSQEGSQNKKERYEKTPVDGVFLARQTLEEEKLIKRYHS